MKSIFTSILFVNAIICFAQKNFTMDEFNLRTDNGEKWENDIKIFLYGDYTYHDSLTVVKTIIEFNNLLESIEVELVNNIDSSNTVIYFTTDNDFIDLFKWSEKDVRNCTGITYTNHVGRKITKCRVHIDIIECEKHKCTPITTRHEMFHILGFGHIENEKNTILKSRNIDFTDKDIEMITLLYKK
jgi:hypothetical protein